MVAPFSLRLQYRIQIPRLRVRPFLLGEGERADGEQRNEVAIRDGYRREDPRIPHHEYTRSRTKAGSEVREQGLEIAFKGGQIQLNLSIVSRTRFEAQEAVRHNVGESQIVAAHGQRDRWRVRSDSVERR
ncbi:MAG: hypothetical protein WBN93_12515 [Acidimicrobiia bacterium]